MVSNAAVDDDINTCIYEGQRLLPSSCDCLSEA